MKKHSILFVVLIACISFPLAGQPALDQYIQEALSGNIALQRQDLSYQKSLAVLQEAKRNFLPQLSIEARYSVARGGRTFEIPAGELVNPAYQNLNLINQLGQSTSPDYPVIPEYGLIPNQEINFLRETEQETKLRVLMPVYNNAIINNQRIRENQVTAEQIGLEAYKRTLVKEVKVAYYRYQSAREALELFNNTLSLVEENLRTTQSLFDNHKVTKDAVYLAKAELARVQQQLADAEKNHGLAQTYFNFLLNRDYKAEIEVETPEISTLEMSGLEAARQQAIQEREELDQLNYYLAASENAIQLNKGNYLPNVNLVADYGIQGTRYSFDQDADYFMGSLVLSWKLFNPANKSKVQQAEIDKMSLFKQKEEVKTQIGMEVVQAWYDVEAARKKIDQSESEVRANEEAFKLIDRMFIQGQANLISWMDARTRLTNAENALIISRYAYLEKLAGLERATGTYSFNR